MKSLILLSLLTVSVGTMAASKKAKTVTLAAGDNYVLCVGSLENLQGVGALNEMLLGGDIIDQNEVGTTFVISKPFTASAVSHNGSNVCVTLLKR